MRKINILLIVLIVLITILMSSSAYAVPKLINYQGKLTDPNGSVLNGEYQMSFSLFNTDTNGTTLWSEQQTIMVADGIYNVQLGAVNPLSASIFDNDALFLEVGIDSDTLSPRQRLTSVAFAIRAKEAETVGGFPVEDLVSEAEFDSKITTQTFTDDQIPDDISINYASIAGDADTLDGKNSTEFGDGHSLDAADGDPVDAVYVDNEGKVGIGTTSLIYKMHVSGSSGITDVNADGGGNAIAIQNKLNKDNVTVRMRFINSDNSGIAQVGAQFPDATGHGSRLFFLTENMSGDTGARMLINETGNIGIGTASPTGGKLHIYNDYWFSGATRCLYANTNGGTSTTAIDAVHGNSGAGVSLASYYYGVKAVVNTTSIAAIEGFIFADNDIYWTKLATPDYALSVNGPSYFNGNVGIGTTNPQYKLDILGKGRFTDALISESVILSFPYEVLLLTGYDEDEKEGWIAIEGRDQNDKFSVFIANVANMDNNNHSVALSLSGMGSIDDNSENFESLQLKWDNQEKVYRIFTEAGGNGTLRPLTICADTSDNQLVLMDSGNVGIGTTSPQGKLDVNGSIYQRGSQLHADYVFEPDYKLESIEDHAKFMWKEKHLKAIPKVKVDENGKEIVEVGSHQRGIVEELEKAHIYIEQLHKRINEMEGLIAKNEALETLVNELSTRTEALESNN